jgi:hypothetical protein
MSDLPDVITPDLIITQEETQKRISFCVNCEQNVLDIINKCDQCNCSISMVTTLSFKTCPIGKW